MSVWQILKKMRKCNAPDPITVHIDGVLVNNEESNDLSITSRLIECTNYIDVRSKAATWSGQRAKPRLNAVGLTGLVLGLGCFRTHGFARSLN